MEGMSCLLQCRGITREAGISGATHYEVSAGLPRATVELAALYYISFLFTGQRTHADGVALWNSDGVINPPGSIDTAYEAYERWFRRVQELGLATAREQGLNPLEGTGLAWYGKSDGWSLATDRH